MKRRDLLVHFAAHGCVLLREGARHSWWHNPALNRRSAVPRYGEVNNHLARKICRDLGVAEPERFQLFAATDSPIASLLRCC